MAKRRKPIEKETLARMYHEERKTTHEIGRELGCSQMHIRREMARHGILARGRHEAMVMVQRKVRWKGYKDILGTFWARLTRSAVDRKLSLTITPQEVWELYERQGRKCALTGVPIVFAKDCHEYYNRVGTASIDRIDPSKGYDLDNIQVVHKRVNLCKRDLTQEEFIIMCRQVAERNNQTINE